VGFFVVLWVSGLLIKRDICAIDDDDHHRNDHDYDCSENLCACT